MAKKPVGDIEVASTDAKGNVKPSIYFLGDYQTWWLHHVEGIEGYHKRLSEKLMEVDTKHKPKRMYLNHGYFKIKPFFTPMVNEQTTDPQPKKRKGFLSGVYQVYDVQNKVEGVMWCYTSPGDLTTWERLATQIDYAVTRMAMFGVNKVDADGYLPAIFKIGKLPTKMGAKYAKIVSWDTSIVPIKESEFMTIDSPLAKESYQNYPPTFANEFENTKGPLLFQ